MWEVEHVAVGLYFDVSTFAAIASIGSSSSNSFIGIVSDDSVAAITGSDVNLYSIWEVFELEFGYFCLFFFDYFGGLAEQSACSSYKSYH
jgi:hypothetical protein